MFTTPIGTPIDTRNFGHAVETLTERVIGRKVNPHALRHTAATLLHEAGVSMKVAQAILGHATSEMTSNIGVAESAGSNVMDRLWPPEDQPAEVTEAAQRVNDQACAILALPAGSVRPSPAPSASAAVGTPSGVLGGLTVAAGGQVDASDDVGITDSVSVELDPATLSMNGVNVGALTGEPVDPATAPLTPTFAVGEPATLPVGDPPQYKVGDVPVTYGSSDPADYDRNSVAGLARRAREEATPEPEVHEATATAFVGVGGAALVSKEVTLRLATEQDSAPSVDATAAGTVRPGEVQLNDIRVDQDAESNVPEDSELSG